MAKEVVTRQAIDSENSTLRLNQVKPQKEPQNNDARKIVGATGFEPTTSPTRSKRSFRSLLRAVTLGVLLNLRFLRASVIRNVVG